MNHKLILVCILTLAALLRLYHLGSNPPALYWDEASIGYNAYSIATAGIDEHGVSFPLTHFLAYGDAKPPLYIYASSLSILFFGVSEFAIRLPSALAGVIAVGLTYLLTSHFISVKKTKSTQPSYLSHLPLLTSLLLTISPWHLHLSRVAYEANLSLTLFLLGLLLFFHGLKRPQLWLISAISFTATLYTFNSYRIFLPLFLLSLAVIFRRHLIAHKNWVVVSIATAAILTAPLVPFVLSEQAQLRFQEVTIFKNHAPVIEANRRQELNQNALWSRIVHNRRFLFAQSFLSHYTDHFKPDFLFFSGDVNPRLSTRDIGQMYLIELPLILIGLYHLLKGKLRYRSLLIIWLLLAPIPAGMARETPHALRSLQILPIPQILTALGIITLTTYWSRLKYVLAIVYLLLFVNYLDIYHHHFRSHWSQSWQYGYKQLVDYVAPIADQYDRVYITQSLGRPHTYFLLYTKKDPRAYVANRDAGGDAFGFTETYGYDNYRFTDPPADQPSDESWLVVSRAYSDSDLSNAQKVITDLENQPVFAIYER